MTSGGAKTGFGTKSSHMKMTSGNQAGSLKGVISSKNMGGIKNDLLRIHNLLMNMPGGDPTKWHKALDEYVVAAAELYKSRSPG